MNRLNKLNGWWRLWIVASGIWMIGFALSRPDFDQQLIGSVSYTTAADAIRIDEADALALASSKYAGKCEPGTLLVIYDYARAYLAESGGANLWWKVHCELSWRQDMRSLARMSPTIFGPPLVILVLSFLLRWIYRGFRPTPETA